LDGELSFLYASAFTEIGRSLSDEAFEQIEALRPLDPDAPVGPYLYSNVMDDLDFGNADFLFDTRSN